VIRDSEWACVREKLDSYAFWNDDESLQVIQGRRAFERKSPEYSEDIKGYSLKEIVGQMFCVYYDEKQADPTVVAGELYEQVVAPAAATALRALNDLLTATERIRRRTLARAARKLITGLEAFESDLRQAWIGAFKGTAENVSSPLDERGILDAASARERLILCLWDYLTDLTNLTREDRFRHIKYLLDHFQIRSSRKPRDKASLTSIHKLINERSQPHREAMTRQWRVMTGQSGDLSEPI
jgi:hypothetical protein